jgi:hypothetical protein
VRVDLLQTAEDGDRLGLDHEPAVLVDRRTADLDRAAELPQIAENPQPPLRALEHPRLTAEFGPTRHMERIPDPDQSEKETRRIDDGAPDSLAS